MFFFILLIWETAGNSHSSHNQRRITRKQFHRQENSDFSNLNNQNPSENHEKSGRRHQSRVYTGPKQVKKDKIGDFPEQNLENDFNFNDLDKQQKQRSKIEEYFDIKIPKVDVSDEKKTFKDPSFDQNKQLTSDIQPKNEEFDDSWLFDDNKKDNKDDSFKHPKENEIPKDDFDGFIDNFDELKPDNSQQKPVKHRIKRHRISNNENTHSTSHRNHDMNVDSKQQNQQKDEIFDDFNEIPKENIPKHNLKPKSKTYGNQNYETNNNDFHNPERQSFEPNYKSGISQAPKITLISQDKFTLSRKRYANFSFTSTKETVDAYCRIDNQIKNGAITNPHNILCPIPSALFLDTVFVSVSFDLNNWSAAEPVKAYPSVFILIVIPAVVLLLTYIKIWFQNRPRHKPKGFSPEKFLPLSARNLKESQFVVDTIDPENPIQNITILHEAQKIEEAIDDDNELEDDNLPDVALETQ